MRATASALPLRARGLGYAAGGRAILHGIDLTLAAGPPTLVLGANGAGKSVLLRLLHGLLQPAAGAVEWQDGDAARRQAMVFQRPVMLRRSAAANVAYRLPGSRTERRAQARALLERVGLAHLADQPARHLSGGEQQRVALARAWVRGPEVLFLDEPTASLDPAATRAVERIVLRIAAEGVKVIMTTHDIGQARRLAGDVVFLQAGRVAEHTPADRFFDQPASAAAAAFLRGEIPEEDER
jgi:tungstate transport system ATP-binding protein